MKKKYEIVFSVFGKWNYPLPYGFTRSLFFINTNKSKNKNGEYIAVLISP
ncbi:hypothetical protein [Sphingobacterium sp. UDSM-2020]|nr:hypothetical protein [Sphingobacterium sp. UDSM-2020]QQD15217.1 hypothetical protein JAZ75_06770 [Sphingobacterium sp. UDSM-2020]